MIKFQNHSKRNILIKYLPFCRFSKSHTILHMQNDILTMVLFSKLPHKVGSVQSKAASIEQDEDNSNPM